MTARRWAIADGRDTVGVVELAADGAFVARDLAGHEIGRFDSLLLASRVFALVESKR